MASIIKYYGGYVPIDKIRDDTITTSNGTNLYQLIKAAVKYGFEATGVRVDNIHDKNIYLPAIAHVVLKNGLNHFVVIYKISNNDIYIMDPARGKVKMKIKEFLQIWDNILGLFMPVNNIIKYDRELSIYNLFLKLLKSNRKQFIIICFITLILIIFSIIGTFYFQIVITMLNKGEDLGLVKFMVLIFFFLTLLKIICKFMRSYYLNYFNKNLDIAVYDDTLKHIFGLPLKFMQNRETGEIVSRVEELGQVKNLLSEIFTSVLLNTVLLIGAALVLYFINAKLFLVLCLIVSIYIGIGLLFSKIIYRKVKNNIEVGTEFNANLIEMIEQNTSIKNLNMEDTFFQKLESKLIKLLRCNFNLQSLLNGIDLMKDFIYEMGLFVIMTLGFYLINQGKLDVLNLVTFNSIILYLFDPVKEILELIPKYNYLKASFSKLSEFLAIKEEARDVGLKTLKIEELEFKKVSFSYNTYKKVLKDVSFKLDSKSKVLIDGPSGAGKSTVCKLIYRIIEGYDGNILLNNQSEKDFSLEAIRRDILYVGQEERLFTGTIRDNIICFRNIREEEFLEVTKICEIEEIVSKRPNRYETIINASINNLSGGERQRIILARALLKKASVIMLDEALSEVSITMERAILKKIMKYYKDKILIYVSHKDMKDCFKNVIMVEDLPE